MSVYKHKKSRFYYYDFWLQGDRFHGPTQCTTRQEARRVEQAIRDEAKAHKKAVARSRKSLAINDVADRLWEHQAQHDADPNGTETNLARLVTYFGEATSLLQIDHDAARKMVAWRRGQRVARRKNPSDAPLVSNATVNRSTTKVLQRLFTFAKAEGTVFENEPKWLELLLKEPPERVRELHDHEADALDDAMRPDYGPFFDFVRASGLRLKECVTLRWSEVNFGSKQIIKTGKGGKRVVLSITPSILEILVPLQGQHAEFVFTYKAKYGNRRIGRVAGERYRLTYNGTKAAWQRLRASAGVHSFRFHDFRHDFGTKLLRGSRNLKLVQKAMNHSDIKSTLRYAHVLDDEVADAVEQLAQSQKKSRNKLREVG